MVLGVQLLERGAVRYTPAGIEAIDLVLGHESQTVEAGQPRRISLQIRAVALGGVVAALAAQSIGSRFEAAGFLSAQRNGRGIVFHVTTVAAAPSGSNQQR
ncbi:MAG TPA: primosomal replication protein N [Ideonella sp.]|nr:primosomal replication protein N [Ideonella sp.]